LETRDGVYWVATGDGLCRFNPQGISQSSGIEKSVSSESTGVNPLFVVQRDAPTVGIGTLLEDHTGTIWIGAWNGLFRLEQSGESISFHFVDLGMPPQSTEDRHVMAIAEDRQGGLWVAAQSSGLYRYWQGRVERYTVRDGLPSDSVHSLLVDHEGNLWVGTVNGLCRLAFDKATDRPVIDRNYTKRDGLGGGWVNAIFQSADGHLWVGTDWLNERVSPALDNKQEFRTYTRINGIAATVATIIEDRDGNLWIGTAENGVMKLARNGFATFGAADGLNERGVSAIFEDRTGKLCVLNSEKDKNVIQVFKGNRLRTVLPHYPVGISNFGWGWSQYGLQDKEGEWWLPTGEGVCRFPRGSSVDQLERVSPKAVYTTRDGLASNGVFRVFEDSHGDIWFSTISPVRSGVTRWERATEKLHHYHMETEFAAANVSSILATSFGEDAGGNIWIGHSLGLIRYAAGRFSFFSKADGVPGGWIRAIYSDGAHRLWIASGQGGLSRIDDPSAEHPHFITYTTLEGLSSDQVNCVLEDQWGRIYAGTGRGVDRLDPASGHIKHYTVADGLVSGEVISAYRDRQNNLWFGSPLGLSRFVPVPDLTQTRPPILISSLRISGEPQRISALGQMEIPMLELASGRNQIQIEFVGLSFGTGETLRYEYMLEGADKDWSPPDEQRIVTFASLSPGSYRFMVKAVTADGISSETPATFSFRILPPIWQRWWFIALAAMLLGLTIYATFRYRLAQLIKLERVRTSIASDLHDDIGSNLSVIAGLSDGLRRQGNSAIPATNEQLSLIAAVSQRSLEAISDIVWAVNPKKDHLHDLTLRMRLFADEAFFAHRIKFRFSAGGAANDTRVGADTRREVFLIFKEAVNNIVRHSSCSEVEARIGLDRRTLVLEINDDGKGFDREGIRPGEGLESMRRRAGKIGAEIVVLSNPGRGTTIRLKAPLR